jgi:methanogenic corrinoid protein MtbC1
MQIKEAEFALLANKLAAALLAIDRQTIKEILTVSRHDFNPYELIEKLVVPALEEIGEGWESGQFSLSQVYMSGLICEEMVDLILPPHMESRRRQPKMAIVVLEDTHLLGKRIVYSILRASGYELINYGRMEVDTLTRKVCQDHIDILLVSVLMLPSALRIKALREALDRQGAHPKIVVGGAPFRFAPDLWREVGADAVGFSAADALNIIAYLSEELV